MPRPEQNHFNDETLVVGIPRTSTCTVIEVAKIDQVCIIQQLFYTANIDANENRKLVNKVDVIFFSLRI